MPKRWFRSRARADDQPPSYPTLDEFRLTPKEREEPELDSGRRDFLASMARLGGVLLGAGTLAACSGRAINQTSADGGSPPPKPDKGPIVTAGGAPLPDARADTTSPEPDGEVVFGEAPQPDAAIDKKDQGYVAGNAPMPDAAIDKKDQGFLGGVAPAPDSMIDCDDSSCPIP
jgi:hypothetical protein